jgi:hypothetical protein
LAAAAESRDVRSMECGLRGGLADFPHSDKTVSQELRRKGRLDSTARISYPRIANLGAYLRGLPFMQFAYEISAVEFAAAQKLYHKLRPGRARANYAFICVVTGLLLIFAAWSDRLLDWPSIFMFAAIGAWWIYSGIVTFFPDRIFRRAYRKSDLAGKKFNANVHEDGLEVVGELCSWRVQWPGIRLKGENERVFMLYSEAQSSCLGKDT